MYNYSAQAPYGVPVYGNNYPQQPMYGYGIQPNGYDPRTAYGYAPGSGVTINPCNVRGISTTSREDEEILKNAGTKEFQITEVDIARSRCNHKDHDGNIKIECVDSAQNKFRCTKCGESFRLIKPSQEAVEELVEMFLDLFQSIKTSWLTPPKEFAENVYTIQCLIKQVPEMYKAAQRDWEAGKRAINNQIQPAYAGGYYANALNGIPQMVQGFYNAPYTPSQQPMNPNYQMMQPQNMGNGYYNQQMMQQPMPVGGNMITSDFVQGGIVPQPSVPVSQAVPFAHNNNPQQPVTQAPQMNQVPTMNIPQPGQPVNNTPQINPLPNTAQRPPQQPGNTTTTSTVKL